MIANIDLVRMFWVEDTRGSIRHFMRNDDPLFTKFGEVYFSTVYPDTVKGWHLHKEMTLNYVCVVGKVLIAVHDPLTGDFEEFTLEDHGNNYLRLTIPPGLWNGFRAPVGWADPVTVANFTDIPHDPETEEIQRVPPDSFDYDWGPYKVGG